MRGTGEREGRGMGNGVDRGSEEVFVDCKLSAAAPLL